MNKKTPFSFNSIPGSIVAPKGFRASGVFCDIKRLGTGRGSNKGAKRDLALIVSDSSAAVAGMFTTNQICAAPVKLCISRVANGEARAVVVNSGNANACTGKQGMKDAIMMTSLTAKQLGLRTEEVLVGSTGRIGLALPMPNVRRGIAAAAKILSENPESANHATEAIMTSDTRQKQIAIEFLLDGKPVRIGGICKGAGMIQPGMSATGKRPAAGPGGLHATMLCFITTDAAIAPKALQKMLQESVAQSFNRVTVDGDMSTNDTVLAFANGEAGNKKITSLTAKSAAKSATKSTTTDAAIFQTALNHVCLELAKMMVRDGEGVHRIVTVRVQGAKNFVDADAAARAVANSALVKTSWHGGDPNWGRIIDTLGYSAATVVEEKVDIGYSAPSAPDEKNAKKVIYSLKRGQPTKTSFKTLCAAVEPQEFDLHIHLNLGKAEAVMIAADLTEAYVEFNKGDVSDPGSLGG